MKALMTRLPEGYSYSLKADCDFCAYSDKHKPVILMKVNQSAMTVLTESTGDFLARSSSAVDISCVMWLRCCLAMFSSRSLVKMFLEHMFARPDKSTGVSNWQRQKVLIASTYPWTVAEQELWSNMSCSIKHTMILLYPTWLPQGSGMFLLLQNSM